MSAVPAGESNRYMHVLTKNFGLIGANVQGVRELRSKLRFSLGLFSHAELALVRGKDVWRVTSAIPLQSYEALFFDKEKLHIFARIASLVRRLVVGETEHTALFDFIFRAALFLATEKLTAKELLYTEALVALSILDVLGYGEKTSQLNHFVGLPPIDKKLLIAFEPEYAKAVSSISRSLRESHL